MKVLILLITLIFLHGCVSIAISPAVEGRIINADGLPVEATVMVEHNQLENKFHSTMSNKDGHYSLSKLRIWTPMPFSSIRLSSKVIVSAPGYKTVTFEVDSYETVARDVQLDKDITANKAAD